MKLPLKNFKISLKLKIAFVFLLLVIAMMITVGYMFTIRELNLRVEQVKLRMERLAQNIATIRSVETEDWDVYQNYIDNQIVVNPDIVYIAIFDERGILKVHALNTNWIDLGREQMLSKLEQASIVLRLDQRQIAEQSQKDFETQSVNIIIGDQNLGTVNIGFSLVELNDEMNSNLSRNLQLGVIFIVLSIIISFFISSRIVTPLGKLTTAMENISQGDLNQELYIKSRDEIGEMANTFNYMAKGLQEKQVIENFSRELGFTIELQKLTGLITKQITHALNARQAYLWLRDKDQTSHYELINSYPKSVDQKYTLNRNEAICEFALKTRKPVPLKDFPLSSILADQLTKFTGINQNCLVCPIIIKDKVLGILLLTGSDETIAFSESEIAFLNTLVGQAGFAIENVLLYEELTEQERLKRELEIARMVQLNLLPQTNPQIPGLDIDGICIPANEIGGDYYDYFKINDHTVGIAIADVTGKGTSAAFYMAMVKGMMLSLTAIYSSPKQLLSELNRRLYGTMDRKIFITMIYATVDMRHKLLKFARAGHNALIRRNEKNSIVECLTPDGIGLGLAEHKIFDENIIEQRIKFQQGDTFIFYTDGISEAMNEQKEEFGEQKLIDIINQMDDLSADQIRERIIGAVKNFVQGTPQHDDITMVTINATYV
ncbi:MAG: SpoIIE family protein phosphatase [bacterium]|nr:MAG: SpoIIE family protein phosphatase [bacterium]